MACRALAQGDCTTVLAGGVNAITSPDVSSLDSPPNEGHTNSKDVSWSFTGALPEPNWPVQAL